MYHFQAFLSFNLFQTKMILDIHPGAPYSVLVWVPGLEIPSEMCLAVHFPDGEPCDDGSGMVGGAVVQQSSLT